MTVNVSMQNAAFNKIIQRLGHLDDPKDSIGISTGDLNQHYQLWFSTFGNIAKQRASGNSSGYRSKALGLIFGIDTINSSETIYGAALSIANNNVTELFNANNTTRMLAYNFMLYGGKNLSNNIFTEWFATAGATKNQSRRAFNINGIDLSSSGSYRGSVYGGYVTLGKSFVVPNNLLISQVNSLQYALLHQPAYSENYSTAALNVATKTNSSVLTAGTGLRFARADSRPWLNGNNDAHIMVTYDVLSPSQRSTASFVVGSNNFIVTSSPARLALKVGADLGWLVYKKLQLQLSYNFEMRAGYYDNFGDLCLRYVF